MKTRVLIWLALALALLSLAILQIRYFDHRTPVSLSNRVVVDGLDGPRGSVKLYRLVVPEGATNLQFSVFGGSNSDAIDVYASLGAPPTTTSYDVRDHTKGAVRMISIGEPHVGTYYLLVHGARGPFSEVSVVGSYSLRGAPFKLGMHAHRLYNGGDEDGPASIEPAFDYGVVRDWDISHLHDAVVWKADGSIAFDLIDKVYAGHARHGAKVLKTFATVPTWASNRPDEPNPKYPSWPGAMSGPRDLDEYEGYVYRFVSHTRKFLWGVEGWNEPYACPGDAAIEFTTMTPTELADVQKRLYIATKRADRNILVFSPAQAYLCGIPTVLEARTSQGEPISKFFDVFAWHAYNRSAHGDAGPAYALEIHQVRQYLARAGLADMPIADTEHGWLPAPKEGGDEFRALADVDKGKVLYDTAQLAKSLGLMAVVWYGYDDAFIGMPMKSRVLSERLQQMYKAFNTSQSPDENIRVSSR